MFPILHDGAEDEEQRLENEFYIRQKTSSKFTRNVQAVKKGAYSLLHIYRSVKTLKDNLLPLLLNRCGILLLLYESPSSTYFWQENPSGPEAMRLL